MFSAILVSIFTVFSLSTAHPNTERIIGGAQAAPGQFPYSVSIQTAVDPDHVCGGSLISDRLIISAASCFYNDGNPANYIAYVGTTDSTNGGTYYNISKLVIHENYRPTIVTYDISLIQTVEPVKMGPNVGTVQLPPDTLDIPDDTNVTVSGWGSIKYPDVQYPTKLYFLQVAVVSNIYCAGKLGTTIVDTQLCAGGINVQGTCYGDAGSPLVLNDTILVGTVSSGKPCAIGYPDIFTRVSKFIDWIETNSALLESLE